MTQLSSLFVLGHKSASEKKQILTMENLKKKADLNDGEYLSSLGVKLTVKDKRIINLIPRGVQTSTTAYGILPPPTEITNSIKFSSEVKRAEVTTLKDLLESTVRTYNLRLIKNFYEKLVSLQQKFFTQGHGN